MAPSAPSQLPIIEAPKPLDNLALKMKDKDKNELVDYLQKKMEMCSQARLPFEQQWYMNMAFYFGRQYVAWMNQQSSGLSRLYEPPAPPYRVRMTVNKCRRIVRTELTKVTRQFPQFYVVPNTTDDDDRMAAIAAEQISEWLIREERWNKKFRMAAHWMTICGTSFLKIYWDEKKPDPAGVPGAICLDPVTPFHILIPDIQEEDLEAQPFIIHTTLKDKEVVKQTWGADLQPNVEVQGGALEQRFFQALGIKSNQPQKDKVQVFEMWLKPCPKFPKGALLSWGDRQLIQVLEEWPYTKTDFPFAKLDHIPTGRFYGDSSLVDLIPIQKEVNRTHSQIIESKNKMAKPQWKAQRGSVDVNKMTSEPGLVIQYTAGFQAPEQVQPASLPSYVVDELERLTREMDDLAATGEITKGNVPPGITAASAISYLQEENDNRFAPTVASIEEATEKVGKYMLSFVDEYWDETRMVKVVGDNRLTETREFSKADVNGNTDFVVETGSAAPRSRAAKQAFLTDLIKMGVIDGHRALKYLDMTETTKLYEDAQVDDRQIAREHVMFKEGQPVEINEFDNDDAHILGHGNWMKGDEWLNLPDPIKQASLEHWKMHQARQQMMMQQQMAQQAMMQGPPSVGGEPVSQRQAPNNPGRNGQ
jgi:hypothetical protein